MEDELIIKISENSLPEYSESAFKSVENFFNKLGFSVGIDNINIHEWMSEIFGMHLNPCIDCCRFAHTREDVNILSAITTNIKPDEPERVVNDLMNKTLLSVYLKNEDGNAIMHFALPYCTVEKIHKNEMNDAMNIGECK